jgi:hypothetical protein
MIYNITTKNQIKSLEHLLIGTTLILLALWYVIKTEEFIDGIPIVFGTIYLLNFVPTVLLHIEYYLKNKNDVFIIDAAENRIIINNQKPILFSDIECVMYIMPPVWHRKGFIKYLSIEDYHYAKIIMKNGEKYIFTSLMATSVEDALNQIKGVKVEKIKLLFATTLIG